MDNFFHKFRLNDASLIVYNVRIIACVCMDVGVATILTLPMLRFLSSKVQQGTTLRLALLPGASLTVKNRVSGKFMA